MEEQVPIAEPEVESSLPSATDAGGKKPVHRNKKTPAKRDPVPRVRKVVRNILRDDPIKPIEVNADFFVSLGKTLRTVERENRERRISSLAIV